MLRSLSKFISTFVKQKIAPMSKKKEVPAPVICKATEQKKALKDFENELPDTHKATAVKILGGRVVIKAVKK